MGGNEHLLSALQGAATFCTTHWSLVLRAGQQEDHRAAEALEELCRTYWYPLYAYARRRGCAPEDAQDLTQGFIESLLSRQDLSDLTPDKGRFRTFLLTALSHYLANHWRQNRREKRGGGRPLVALDGLSAEEFYRLEPATDETPERLYDRKWAWQLLHQARQSLGAEYARAGKGELFELLGPFLTGGRDAELRAEIAAKFGISTGAVDVALHRLRRRYGEVVRELIAQTVLESDQVDAEIKYLMAALSE